MESITIDFENNFTQDDSKSNLHSPGILPFRSAPLATLADSHALANAVKKTELAFNFQSNQHVRKMNIWEPPISCQRRFSHIASCQLHFPIELTSRDYFHRAISIISIIIDLLDLEKLQKAQSTGARQFLVSENAEIQNKYEEFINLILANNSRKKSYEMTTKLHLLASLPSKPFFDNLLKYVGFLMDIKDRILDDAQHRRFVYDHSVLSDEIVRVFDTVYSFLILLQEYLSLEAMRKSLNNSIPSFVSNGASSVTIDRMILEIKDLQNQIKLHRTFQWEKLSYLGWATDLMEHSVETTITGKDFQEESKESPRLNYFEIITRSESIKRRIDKILQNSKEAAMISLITRIFTIIEDLTVLSNEIGGIGDYQEAYRLRQLSSSIDLSINSNYCSLPHISDTEGIDEDGVIYFDFRKYLDELYVLKNDLYRLLLEMTHLFENLKSRKDFEKTIQVQNMIDVLNGDYENLLFVTRKVSLLNQQSVVQRIHAEGTGFINANYLFLTAFDDENINIASLLICSESEYLLRAIESWPELTALNRSSFNLSQSISGAKNIEPTLEFDQRSQYQSITDVSSYVPSDWNSTIRNVSSSAGRITVHNTAAGIDNNHLGFTSSLVLSNNSQYKKEFTQLIFGTLQSFEILLQQLNLLLTAEAVSHSELICRLIGIRDDLYSLIEVNTHATNQIEAERLLDLVNAIDNTIDADEEDHLHHHPYMMVEGMSARNITTFVSSSLNNSQSNHYNQNYSPYTNYLMSISNHEIGRGRKRVDNIYHLLKVVVEGMNELAKLKSRAKSINDFIAVKSIDQIVEILKLKVESLEKSISPFHLLDHENDVTSYGHPHHPKISQSLILDINERIAREGTEFLTSDFLFSYCCGSKGHSIGSLAIVAGAGAVLRYIKSFWPEFTALGGSGVQSRGNTSEAINSSAVSILGGKANKNEQEFSSMIDFRNANTLRLLGFDARSLQLAGFSTVDILTAGFTADQLKSTGFGIELIRSIPHFDHYFTKAIGYQLETQGKILLELFFSTNGSQWKRNDFWLELENSLERLASSGRQGVAAVVNSTVIPSVDNVNNFMNNSKPQLLAGLLATLKKLFGISIQEPSVDLVKRRSGVEKSNRIHPSTSQAPNTLTVSNSSNSINPQQQVSSNTTVNSTVAKTTSNFHSDLDTSEITKIILPQNSLQGVLPSGLGSLTTLLNLTLSMNSLKGEIPASIGLLIHLEVLCLDHNQFEGEIPRTLKNLSQLLVLRLEHNRLHGSIPSSLGNLSKLRRLDASHNNLSGPLPQKFGHGLSRIQEILLGNNQLSGEVPTSWTFLTQMTHLELQSNQLSGALPLNWGKLTKLTGLNLQNNNGLVVDRLALQRSLPKCRIKL